jgi:lysylphosphatidylglycerol synthetase-like protein (DUF2156 family)
MALTERQARAVLLTTCVLTVAAYAWALRVCHTVSIFDTWAPLIILTINPLVMAFAGWFAGRRQMQWSSLAFCLAFVACSWLAPAAWALPRWGYRVAVSWLWPIEPITFQYLTCNLALHVIAFRIASRRAKRNKFESSESASKLPGS